MNDPFNLFGEEFDKTLNKYSDADLDKLAKKKGFGGMYVYIRN